MILKRRSGRIRSRARIDNRHHQGPYDGGKAFRAVDTSHQGGLSSCRQQKSIYTGLCLHVLGKLAHGVYPAFPAWR
jgi:hypothetical protein